MQPATRIDYENQLCRCFQVSVPAVAAPIGLTADGLPVGMQIIAPNWHEKRAIQFARLVRREIGGFRPPPGFDG